MPAHFDPRQARLLGADSHLPPVPPERLAPHALRQRFAAPPAWQPEVRREPRLLQRPPAAAAVLIGLLPRPEGATALLTRRAAHLKHHSGQIAFPGGKTDPGDGSPQATALREAEEEIGLPARAAQVLGALPPYHTGTQYIVTPIVALIAPDTALRPNPAEVDQIFEVPLAYLMNPAHHRRHTCTDASGAPRQWFAMPYTHPATGQEHYIWGATAGMLRNLYRFLQA